MGVRGTGHDLADAERSDEGDSSELHCECGRRGECIFGREEEEGRERCGLWGESLFFGRNLCLLSAACAGRVAWGFKGWAVVKKPSGQRSVRAMCCSRVGDGRGRARKEKREGG